MFRILSLFIILSILPITIWAVERPSNSAEEALKFEVRSAIHSLYQGDKLVAEKLIKSKIKSSEISSAPMPLQRLQVMLWVLLNESDKAIDMLLNMEKQHSKNADFFFFAGGQWKELANQVSVFSKVKFYRRAVDAYIRAGELAPNNAKYVRKQASSFAQPKMFGGQKGKQKTLLSKIQSLDPIYGLIASIDLAQNEENEQKAYELAELAAIEYPNTFLLIERAAQMHWTLGNYEKAQHLFSKACEP
jgi:tetratricopeptide (TPR) repeat protein